MKAITANAVSQNGKMNTESNHHNGEGRGAQQTFPLCDLCIIALAMFTCTLNATWRCKEPD